MRSQAKGKQLNDTLRYRALALYTAPFTYDYGYIFDAQSNVVADDRDNTGEPAIALRVRGWGRIAKEAEAADLQDAVGNLIAEALTAFWEQHRPADTGTPVTRAGNEGGRAMKKTQNPEYYFSLDGPQDARGIYIRKSYDDYTGTSFGLPLHHAAIADQCRAAMEDIKRRYPGAGMRLVFVYDGNTTAQYSPPKTWDYRLGEVIWNIIKEQDNAKG